MPDTTATREVTTPQAATRVRPRLPCCNRQQYLTIRPVLAAETLTAACAPCGTTWAVTRTMQTCNPTAGTRTDRYEWARQAAGVAQVAPVATPAPSVNDGAPTAQDEAATAAGRLAAALGEDVGRIVTRDAQWARYMQEGAHVAVTFRRWRAVTRATLADLGLEPDLERYFDETDAEYNARVKTIRDQIAGVLQLGHWRLLPERYVKRAEAIEVRGRVAVEHRAYKTHWGWWLHTLRYAEFKEAWAVAEARYMALAAEVYERWDDLMDEVREGLLAAGTQAYARARRSAAYAAGLVTLPETAGEFAAAFAGRVMAQIPGREAVRARYQAEYTVELIPLASQVAQDEARAQRIRLDAVTAAMAEDIRRTEAAKAAEGVQRFVADVKAQIRAQVYDAAVDALEVLANGKGKVNGGTARSLRALCDATSKAVFWEDAELEARLDALRAAVDVAEATKTDEAVTGALQALGAEARIVLLELDRVGGRRARPELGLPDDLGVLAHTARRARPSAALDGLDMADVAPQAVRGGTNAASMAVAAL